MTNSETKKIEAESIIFPANSRETKLAKDSQSSQSETVKQSVKTDTNLRFARLKKSLKKRSVSIL